MPEVWAWMSGWGICPQRFKAVVQTALPEASHIVFPPSSNSVEAALKLSEVSHFGGYSLGSLLLLKHLNRIPEEAQVLCIAPILGFCREDQCGGTTPRIVLEKLQVRLATDPLAALKVFYRLADLSGAPTNPLPYSKDDLTWGLRQLASLKVAPRGMERVRAVIGKRDRLLDWRKTAVFFEKAHLIEASHDYHSLCTEDALSDLR